MTKFFRIKSHKSGNVWDVRNATSCSDAINRMLLGNGSFEAVRKPTKKEIVDFLNNDVDYMIYRVEGDDLCRLFYVKKRSEEVAA